MTVELGLVSVLEAGESASFLPPDATPDSHRGITFSAADPDIASVNEDGTVVAHTAGTTTIAVRRDGETVREMPLTVIDPPEAAPALRPEHPRLRFSPDEIDARREMIAALRENTDSVFNDDVVAFFEIADTYADEDTLIVEWDISGEHRQFTLPNPAQQPEPLEQPVSFTDYPFWTWLSRNIEQRMVTLSAAWMLTGERRYADKAKAQLLALAGWSKWHEYDKATNNLSLPHFTMAAAIAYDELYDLLSDGERATVREAIITLGMRPMTLWHESDYDHNINVLMNAGMLMGFLAVGDEAPHLDKYYHGPVGVLQWYLNERATSTITEGHVYTTYAVGTILPIASSIRRATGHADLFASGYIRDELIDFFIYFKGGSGGYTNLADARYDTDPTFLMLLLYNEFRDPRAAWVLSHRPATVPSLVPWLHPDLPAFEAMDLDHPRSRHFSRFDWVALRSGWTDDDALLAFVASPSDAGHNHYDQNHFILNIGGEWLVTDPGYQNYTPGPEADFSTQSFGHNCVLVNGQGQTIRGNGAIIASDLGGDADYVVGDATPAYQGALARWHRHVVFVPGGYALLVDDARTNDPGDRIEVLFHTTETARHHREDLAIGAESSEAAGYTFAGKEHAVSLAFDAPGGVTVQHRQHPGAERYGTWLAVEPRETGSTVMVTLLDLDPDANQPATFDVTRDGDTVEISVTHSGGTDRHRMALGTSPSWTMTASA